MNEDRLETDSFDIGSSKEIIKQYEQGIEDAISDHEAKVAAAMKKLNAEHARKLSVLHAKRNKELTNFQNFWGDVLVRHGYTRQLIDEDDIEIFGYLSGFEVVAEKSDKEDERREKVIFKFETNPYFANDQLVKTYVFEELFNHQTNNLKSQTYEKIKWTGQQKHDLDEPPSKFFEWYQDTTCTDDMVFRILKEDVYNFPLKWYVEEEESIHEESTDQLDIINESDELE